MRIGKILRLFSNLDAEMWTVVHFFLQKFLGQKTVVRINFMSMNKITRKIWKSFTRDILYACFPQRGIRRNSSIRSRFCIRGRLQEVCRNPGCGS